MKKWMTFWLTPKKYPNGYSFTRFDVLKSQCVAFVALLLCLCTIWALQFPVAYIFGCISKMVV